MTVKKSLAFILFLLCGMILAADTLPFNLNPEWSCYASNEIYKLVKTDKIKAASENIKGIQRRKITLDNGFCKLYNHFMLINEFHSEKDGVMYIRCGTESVQLELSFNGKQLFDLYSSFLYNRPGMPGSHDIALPVKKGKNILVIRCPAGRFYIGAGTKENWQATQPTRKNFASIQYAADGTPQRDIEEMLVRNGVDNMNSTAFKKFRYEFDLSAKKLEKIYDKYPILEFYDRGIQKILKELPETKVTSGAVVWLVYNMGYVVKTPEACFGIDIHHRLAKKLVPYLDFAIISHKHTDHYDSYFCQAMADAGKPVISNFLPGKEVKKPPADRVIKDIKMEFHATDHNAKLRNYVMCSRITCGRGKDAVVIYHTGDTGYAKQLKPSGKVDIHILHPRVGLSVPEAATLIKPGAIWFSHMLEMAHCKPSRWRPIEYAEGHLDAEFIKKRGDKVNFRFPLWGEKIVVPAVK